MKNILTLLLLTAACAAHAVSTCETRVDSHQKATTRQRVVYCLTEEAAPAASAGPELVYSGTYSKEPDVQEPVKSTAKKGYFKENKVSIYHQYVGSGRFPAFSNDTLSQQEKAALEQAYLKELEQQKEALEQQQKEALAPLAVKKATSERAPARLEAPTEEEAQAVSPDVLASGLKARQQKPKRILKAALEEDTAQPALEQPAEPAGQAALSQSEVAVQNDPLLSDSYQGDDLLEDELGLEEDGASTTPIPPSVNN